MTYDYNKERQEAIDAGGLVTNLIKHSKMNSAQSADNFEGIVE